MSSKKALKDSLVAQRLKHLPAMRETWVRSLGQEDPLEKEMATHSSIFTWRIPWMEEPGGLQSMGSQSRTRLSDFTFTFKKGLRNETPGSCWRRKHQTPLCRAGTEGTPSSAEWLHRKSGLGATLSQSRCGVIY